MSESILKIDNPYCHPLSAVMGKSLIPFLVGVFVLILNLSYSGQCVAAPDGKNSIVYMVLYLDKVEDGEELKQAIYAGTNDMDVHINVLQVEAYPGDNEFLTQMDSHISQENVLSAFWCQTVGEQRVHLLSREGGSLRLQKRIIESTSASGTYESAAIIVRAWLSALLQQHAEQQVGQKESDKNNTEEPAHTTEPNPEAKEPENTPEKSKGNDSSEDKRNSQGEAAAASKTRNEAPPSKKQRPWLKIGLSYGVRVESAKEPFVSNGTLSFAGILSEHVGVFAAYSLSQSTEYARETVRLTRQNHPFQLGILFHILRPRFHIGMAVSFVFAYIARIVETGSSDWDVSDEGTVQLSMLPGLFADMHLIKNLWLSVLLGGDVRLRGQRDVVQMGDDKYEIGSPFPVQPVVFVGLSFLF